MYHKYVMVAVFLTQIVLNISEVATEAIGY
jgi:hypothetical protein